VARRQMQRASLRALAAGSGQRWTTAADHLEIEPHTARFRCRRPVRRCETCRAAGV
jgi:hypothetical protein